MKAYHAQNNSLYVSFDLEDFGTDSASPTSFIPEEFKLVLIKKDEILEVNGRSVPRARHRNDAIKLVKTNEPGTAAFYVWRPIPNARFESVKKNGTYAISGFGGLGNE